MVDRLAFVSFVAMMAVAILSMGAYAWLGRRRDVDVVSKGGQFMAGVGDFPLHWFMWVMTPAVTISRTLGLTPDIYNYVGLVIGIAGGVLIGVGRLELAGWAIVIGGIADVLDGRIARLTETTSTFGDFVDSTFDRFVEAATFIGFMWYLRGTTWGPVISGTAMAGSLIVSYARARGEVHGVNCTGGLMQRAERMLLIALVCFLGPTIAHAAGFGAEAIVLWVLGLIAVTTWLTAVYRTVWIAARLR
jgi:CDP-diacylglycerol--glycerol-3-phosphate 3-phosphatidyltransferase